MGFVIQRLDSKEYETYFETSSKPRCGSDSPQNWTDSINNAYVWYQREYAEYRSVDLELRGITTTVKEI